MDKIDSSNVEKKEQLIIEDNKPKEKVDGQKIKMTIQKETRSMNLCDYYDVKPTKSTFFGVFGKVGQFFSVKKTPKLFDAETAGKEFGIILSKIKNLESKECYKEIINNLLNYFLDQSDKKPPEYFHYCCEQLLAQAERLHLKGNILSEAQLKELLKENIKENFKKLNNGEFSSQCLKCIDKETNIELLFLIEMQLDYGLKMKEQRRIKYASSEGETFEGDWDQEGSPEEINRMIQTWRLMKFEMLTYDSNLGQYTTDFFELAASGNSQALTNTFYLASIDKKELLKKDIVQNVQGKISLPKTSYEMELDQRNIKITKEESSLFFKEKQFVAKGKSECHYESVDYVMEVGEELGEGFRVFKKGYLLYELANPAGKMVRFELPIDLSAFGFQSGVGVNEAIKLMLGFYDHPKTMDRERELEKLTLLLNAFEVNSREYKDVFRLIENYDVLSAWAKETANTLSGLYEKIYLSLSAETTLPQIQNVEDEMGFYYLNNLSERDKEIAQEYKNYLVELDKIKTLVLQKNTINRAEVDRLKNSLISLVEKQEVSPEELFIIKSYLEQQIQDVQSYHQKRDHLKRYVDEVKKECFSFLDIEKLPPNMESVLMNRKITRDFLHFLRACQIAREENIKADTLDMESYHNQRLLKLCRDLSGLIAANGVVDEDVFNFLIELQKKAFETKGMVDTDWTVIENSNEL